MEFTIHHQVLLLVFVVALLLGAVANRTNFCTMGAVSDWVNMGDTGRMRAWLLSMAVALGGVLILEATSTLNLNTTTFPPYRTTNFAWLRYVIGGLMFGIGMTFASGCGNKTMVRIGAGNLKSLVVLVIAAIASYMMLWTSLFEKAFNPWISATTIDLAALGFRGQELAAIFGGMAGVEDIARLHVILGTLIVLALLLFAFRSAEFRSSSDNILGGVAVGLAVVAGWYITGGPMGAAWKEFAELADELPSRVQVQSFTFISPMGDTVRFLMEPTNLSLVNFGVVALSGVILGSLCYAVLTGGFRVEWFASMSDFANHAIGAALMGFGGALAMGCTVGQAITGVSTLAFGSILTFVSIVAGAAGTMKFQYWRLMREA
jgi:hypothetical protein